MYSQKEKIIIGVIISLILLIALASCRTERKQLTSVNTSVSNSDFKYQNSMIDSLLYNIMQQQIKSSTMVYHDYTSVVDSIYVREYTDSDGVVHQDRSHKNVTTNRIRDSCSNNTLNAIDKEKTIKQQINKDSVSSVNNSMSSRETNKKDSMFFKLSWTGYIYIILIIIYSVIMFKLRK